MRDAEVGELAETLDDMAESILALAGYNITGAELAYSVPKPAAILQQAAAHLRRLASEGRERDEAQSTVTAWQQVFESIEAHILDRINMRDEANPKLYLDIIRSDVARVIDDSRAISASRWHEAKRSRERLDASESEVSRLRGKVEEAVKVHKRLSSAIARLGTVKDGKPLFESSPSKDPDCYDAWVELNEAQRDARGEKVKRFSEAWLRDKILDDQDDPQAGPEITP